MALKPVIYKFKIALTDLDRDYYDALALTVALHPSETIERMMMRVLVYCLNAEENLQFTKGLSSAEEPDLWLKRLDDQIELWLDVGEPSVERVKKVSRLSSTTKIYCFNTKSNVWWQKDEAKFKRLAASFYRVDWEGIKQLATFVERTMNMSVTVSDSAAFVATNLGECEIAWQTLYEC